MKLPMRLLIIFFVCASFLKSFSQPLSNTISGQVIDAQTQATLQAAIVVLYQNDSIINTAFVDSLGSFNFPKTKVGRYDLKCILAGYKNSFFPNILVQTGKELVLTLQMERNISQLKEARISGNFSDRGKLDQLAQVTVLRVEDIQKYAGGRADIARIAQNTVGVTGASDSRNDLIIRGNSPLGMLWRLEGVNIPSPNHFATFGPTGGPVSIINVNSIDYGNFYNAVFPSEYGNALSGVFDVHLRKGNNKKREYTLQFGMNGLEGNLEGPFKKGKSASYLITYRYSTMKVFDWIGIRFGVAAIPHYQDAAFKFYFPKTKTGNWTIFGVGGKSSTDVLAAAKRDASDRYSDNNFDKYIASKMFVTGISNFLVLSKKNNVSLKSVVAYSMATTQFHMDSVLTSKARMLWLNNTYNLPKLSWHQTLSWVPNPKNEWSGGVIVEQLYFSLSDSIFRASQQQFITRFNFKGQSQLVQLFAQYIHHLNDALKVNIGLHSQYYGVSKKKTFEPRLFLEYQFTPKQTLQVGAGRHAQTQPLPTTFYETQLTNGTYLKTNQNLDFTFSDQFCLNYTWAFYKKWNLQINLYQQQLFNAPIEQVPSSFSLLNEGADFTIHKIPYLINNGKGQNKGVEFTLEKRFAQHYYGLLNGTYYRSVYTASDGLLRSSAFDNRFAFNCLGGYEWQISSANSVNFDAKLSLIGGKRYTPVNLAASLLSHTAVYESNNAFSKQFPTYFRPDIKISWRNNHAHFSQEFILYCENFINRKNYFTQDYDEKARAIVTEYQIGIFPVAQYKIEF